MWTLFLKKTLGIPLLCFLFLLNAFPCTCAEVIPGDTQENPIIIKSCADLEVFSQDVSSGNSYTGKYIRLESDIYITKHEVPNGEAVKWEPIGFAAFNSHNKEKLIKTKSFDGFFDGNGKTIYCNINGFYQSNEFCKASAIFGCLGKNGVIKNLNVEGKIKTNNIKVSPAVLCNVNLGVIKNCNLNVNVNNEKGVNGISFANYGTISNCKVNGNFETCNFNCSTIASLNYGKIEDCVVNANLINGKDGGINSEDNYQMPETGGVSNFNKGEISKCKVKANIVSVKDNKILDKNNNIDLVTSYHGIAGGIASTNEGYIKECTFNGRIRSFYSGAIVGMNYMNVDACEVKGAIIEGIRTGKFSGTDIVGVEKNGKCLNCQGDAYIKVIAGNRNTINKKQIKDAIQV